MKTKFSHIAFVFFILICSHSLTAQYKSVLFDKLSLDDGLSNQSVTCILQDKSGFIWISTENGLNRFDGSRFKIFYSEENKPNTLCHNLIWKMFLDSRGKIWIATQKGFSIFDPESEKFENYFHDPEDSTSLSHNAVLSFTEDHTGTMWIGTANGELNKFNPITKSFKKIVVPTHGTGGYRPKYIVDLLTDKFGKIWVGMYDGFSILDPETETFTPIKKSEKPDEFQGIFIRDLFEDSKGNIWIATSYKGFYKYDPESKTYTHYGTNKIPHLNRVYGYHVIEDNNGYIWLGTFMHGIYILDPDNDNIISLKSDPIYEGSLSDNNINSFFTDNTGAIWIGTYFGGINIFNVNSINFEFHKHHPFKNSLNNAVVEYVLEDSKKNIWLSVGNKIQEFNRKTYSFRTYSNKDKQNYINADKFHTILEDSENTIWVGTNNGLSYKKIHQKYFSSFVKGNSLNNVIGDHVLSLFEQREKIWIGTEKGLCYYSKRTGNIEQINNTDFLSIYCINILSQSKNEILLGTQKGLYIFNLTNNSVLKIETRSKELIVTDIFKFRGNEIWLSTNYGLAYFDYDNISIKTYSENLVNLSDKTYYLKTKSNQLYAGNSNGLYVYDVETDSFKPIVTSDNKSSNAIFSLFEDKNGNLLTVSIDGVRKFDPVSKSFNKIYFNKSVDKAGISLDAHLQLSTGEIFIGSHQFFVIFNPDNIPVSDYEIKTIISELLISSTPVKIGKLDDGRTILSKPVSETNEVILDYSDQIITLNYSSTQYGFLSRNKYRFELKGPDYNITEETYETSVTFRNLSPGKYTFSVYGSTIKGTWDPAGSSLNIIITPPFHKTLWFRIIVIMLIVIIIYTIYHLRIRIINKKNTELRLNNQKLNAEISERKRAEQIAKDSEIKYRSLFASIFDSIFIVDPKSYNFLECNQHAIDIYGYSKDEFLKMNMFSLFPPKDIEKVKSIISKGNIKGPLYFTHIKKNGSSIAVEIRSEDILFKGKRAHISIVRDVSEIKKAVQEKELLNQNLELKNQELEQIIYVSSHDLRTPLVNIQGFSSELEMELNDIINKLGENEPLIKELINGSVMDSLNYIKTNTVRMDLLLNGLLRFSRIGKDNIKYETININMLLDSAISSLKSLFNKNRVIIKVEELPDCYGDFELLTQVFNQLIENAILYKNPEHDCLINVTGYNKNGTTTYIVEDNGIGIAEEHQKIIFDIFHQLNPRSTQGIGLGLTFASKIIRAHNGNLEVESELNKGSKFIISLPQKE